MEFSHNGNTYKAGTIPAMQQFHVARRLAPALEKLLKIDGQKLDAAKLASGVFEGDLSPVLGPVLEAVSCLPDEDVEYVINTCLNAVDMQQSGGAWAPVRHAGVLMFPLDMPAMLVLTYHAIRANMAGFTQGLPSTLSGAGRTSSAAG